MSSAADCLYEGPRRDDPAIEEFPLPGRCPSTASDGFAREVDNGIRPLETIRPGTLLDPVPMLCFHRWREHSRVSLASREYDSSVPFFGKPGSEQTPDKSRTPGDHESHGRALGVNGMIIFLSHTSHSFDSQPHQTYLRIR